MTFNELRLPCHTTGAVPVLWYTGCRQVSEFLLNNCYGQTATTSRPLQEFYFTSEMAVLEHMVMYYNHHGKLFPYGKQLQEALAKEKGRAAATSIQPLGTVESQVMEFV